MFNLSPVELLLILAVVLIFIGPGKLPETGAAIGKAMRGFRQAVEGKEPDEAAAAGNPIGQPSALPVAPPMQGARYPAYAGAPYPAQPYPAQPYPAQPGPQPYPAQPYTAQPYPAPAPSAGPAAAPAATPAVAGRDEPAG